MGAEFTGTRPNVVEGNRFFTGVSRVVQANDSGKIGRNAIAAMPPELLDVRRRPGRYHLVLTGEDRGLLVLLQQYVFTGMIVR